MSRPHHRRHHRHVPLDGHCIDLAVVLAGLRELDELDGLDELGELIELDELAYYDPDAPSTQPEL